MNKSIITFCPTIFLNVAQVLNAIFAASSGVWFLWTRLLPAAAIVLVTAKFPVTKTYASE